MKTAAFMLSLLSLAACDLPGEAPRTYPKQAGSCRTVNAQDHNTWSNCMVGHAPKKLYPGYTMETTDWRGR